MEMEVINSLEQVRRLKPEPGRSFHSAQHDEIVSGATTDIYFVRTYEILKSLGKVEVPVTVEIFPRKGGIICGVEEVLELLKNKKVAVWGLPEGRSFEAKEIVMRIRGPYSEFGIFETTILGLLANSSG
ncbi:MAG: nicotinate phosphoribosyltransferase, partial [Firmicutes bacterium]|nr:nicotinate phosphoribosyltransferase [Bacillota bacterium]